MRVLLAGASGTLGRALAPALREAGHDVVGIARSPDSARALEARGIATVTADVLDREALLIAVRGLRADAVMNQLTALKSAPTHYRSMRMPNELRTTGTAHLLEVAREVGATRFVTQSIVFGYGYRRVHPGVVTESAPFAEPEGGRVDAVHAALAENEHAVLSAAGLDGIALRYGLFYGIDADAVRAALRRRMLPVTRSAGVIPMIHHLDAASATVAALERGLPGRAYNVADDRPATWREHIETAARALAAPAPLTVPAGLVRAALPFAGELMTRLDLRVSSDLARRELGWTPRYPSIAEGWAAAAEWAA